MRTLSLLSVVLLSSNAFATTYTIGPLTATNGDEISGSLVVNPDGSSNLDWQATRGGESTHGGRDLFGSPLWLQDDNGALEIKPGATAYYTRLWAGPDTPITDQFSFTLNSAGTDLLIDDYFLWNPVSSYVHTSWDVPLAAPYVIGTDPPPTEPQPSAPEPSAWLLLVLGALLLRKFL